MAIIVSCKKITVDFTYEPTAPRAGQTIKFTNNSSAGENWAWSFGDNTTSISKHPNKIYKKPGKYLVTLMVDSAKHQTRSKEIEVFDTVPTFVASSDSILHYHDVTFTANVYNPFNYKLSYEWQLPNNCVIVSGKQTGSAIQVYFTSFGNDTLQLTIHQNNNTYCIQKEFTIYEAKAPAIVIKRTDNTVLRQRIINDRVEHPTLPLPEDIYLLESATDTVVKFNDTTFYASQMQTIFPNQVVNHIQLDPITQKWYITSADGLFVANMNGNNIVQIDSKATGAIYVDTQRNRIYWATDSGLYAMPLIKSKNNQFSATPERYNDLTNIDLITVNNKHS